MKTDPSSWASSISPASPTVWPCWSTISSTPSSIRASASDEQHHPSHLDRPRCPAAGRCPALPLVRCLEKTDPQPDLPHLPGHRRALSESASTFLPIFDRKSPRLPRWLFAPNWHHFSNWLGTDIQGFPVIWRLPHGTRIALIITTALRPQPRHRRFPASSPAISAAGLMGLVLWLFTTVAPSPSAVDDRHGLCPQRPGAGSAS